MNLATASGAEPLLWSVGRTACHRQTAALELIF